MILTNRFEEYILKKVDNLYTTDVVANLDSVDKKIRCIRTAKRLSENKKRFESPKFIKHAFGEIYSDLKEDSVYQKLEDLYITGLKEGNKNIQTYAQLFAEGMLTRQFPQKFYDFLDRNSLDNIVLRLKLSPDFKDEDTFGGIK
ncbi:MAG: hypothetical protein WCX73_05545 [Candidatus Pacearchaeota archaeon]|jgi:hypothetical protein